MFTCAVCMFTCAMHMFTCAIYMFTCAMYMFTCAMYMFTCVMYMFTCAMYIFTCVMYMLPVLNSIWFGSYTFSYQIVLLEYVHLIRPLRHIFKKTNLFRLIEKVCYPIVINSLYVSSILGPLIRTMAICLALRG